MKCLTKDEILARRKRTLKPVELPWVAEDSGIYVQTLRAIEVSRWRKTLLDKDGNPDPKKLEQQRERLVVIAAVDENGTRMFTNEDLEALNNSENGLVDAIYNSAEEHNGQKFDLPKVEDTAGNSNSTTDDSQPTD